MRAMTRSLNAETVAPYLFILPAIALFIVFSIYSFSLLTYLS